MPSILTRHKPPQVLRCKRGLTLLIEDIWDDEYDDAGARQFAELVCAFVGVTPVALERKNAKRQPARVAKPSIVG